jgi:hypothetical protein
MIKIENVEIVGFEAAIRGMRNPMNSWDKSDSGIVFQDGFDEDGIECGTIYFKIGNNDLELMKKLSKAGTDHRKFMRMIVVYVDVTAPMYWLKEADTYKVGTVRNSCSTMHKITSREFTLDDFSTEHLLDEDCGNCFIPDPNDGYYGFSPLDVLKSIIEMLNKCRNLYLETKDKQYWWQMIQLLPSSYNQRSTLMLNYEVLANIYHSRKNHRLTEWRTFCEWVKTLPYSELITGGYDSGDTIR